MKAPAGSVLRLAPRRLDPRRLVPRRLVLALLPLLAVAVGGCGGPQSILGTDNPAGERIESLWWVSVLSTGILAAVVIVVLLVAARRALVAGRGASARGASAPGASARGGAGDVPVPDDAWETKFLLVVGGALPALFLVGFLVFSVRTGTAVTDAPGEPGLTVEVVGHKFWWEVRYPDQGIVTANEIRIPAGVSVEVLVSAADVIHSFWVPALTPGKIDMVPGRTNVIRMWADNPGVYRGQCTEFCGTQHALMSMEVVAVPPDEFDAWAESRRLPPLLPDDDEARRGIGVFMATGCAACHAVEGLTHPGAAGSPGPDLTDVAGRRSLGALALENSTANLLEWIRDPHQFKPGVRMPPTPLPESDLRALVRFLEGLEWEGLEREGLE
ncbi:MAG: cytochrome c oxidase subunit II [Gemmatimonadales bacterium]|nr:MAG: cytochrome c oxidase subunit II [Gemmatimonadales bacterium]